jgi:multidrug resistance efflux pump
MEENKQPVNKKVIWLGAALIVLLLLGTLAYYLLFIINRVYTDQAVITAPQISLAPTAGGELQAVMVNVGDVVDANTPVARVGDQVITTQTGGMIVKVNNNIGQIFSAGQAVVTMIDPAQLRVVVQMDEDKGLADIKIGQQAIFTVDAFGSKKYVGTVDEISPTSDDSAVVFNISDTRETKQFDVKIRYNTDTYPELKNGMSAKVTIYTK